jgi:hypothetical protein
LLEDDLLELELAWLDGDDVDCSKAVLVNFMCVDVKHVDEMPSKVEPVTVREALVDIKDIEDEVCVLVLTEFDMLVINDFFCEINCE